MAKGKRAVALFEVIQKDKRFGRKTVETPVKPVAAPMMAHPPMPSAPAPVAKEPAESHELAEQAVDLWRKRHSDPETWTFPAARKSIGNFGKSAAARARKWGASAKGMGAKAAGLAEAARIWVLGQNSVVCGVAVALVMIGGLTTARELYHRRPAVKPIEVSLREGPAHPAVLNVASESPGAAMQGNGPMESQLSPEMQADVRQAGDKVAAQAAANLAQPGQRVVNMHYVLMQSYFEEKTAIEARDFLAANGIPCTIERGVKGWRPDFYQVIGLQGFPRASGAEYLAYKTKIEELGKNFSKSRYKRFQPEAIKW
jgi:hypothetical protein